MATASPPPALNYRKLYDISPLLSAKLAVFPGDTPFSLKRVLSQDHGNSCQVSAMTTTLHAGAHVDAEMHTLPGGSDVSTIALERFIGPCQVIRVAPKRRAPHRLTPADIADITVHAPRVLFATDSFADPNTWRDDFTALSPELIHVLAQQQVTLVGIDTPSVDPSDSKALESHAALREQGIINLEGLLLNEVPEGLYTLIALPLKIQGADGAPVRAVLLSC